MKTRGFVLKLMDFAAADPSGRLVSITLCSMKSHQFGLF